MKRKIASWTTAVITIGIGLWCLYWTAENASFALSSGGINGMPIDMRITAVVSSGVTMTFTCLFLLSGASSILRSQKKQANYYPTLLKVATLIFLIVLSVLARLEYEATTKISWEESRGLPFAFLTFTEIRGLCSAGIAFWKCRSFESINFLFLIIDILILYMVCASVQTLFGSSSSNSPQWSLKNSGYNKANGG